ncbi:hypothetical protein D3C80_1887130 [compost metagenome]
MVVDLVFSQRHHPVLFPGVSFVSSHRSSHVYCTGFEQEHERVSRVNYHAFTVTDFLQNLQRELMDSRRVEANGVNLRHQVCD